MQIKTVAPARAPDPVQYGLRFQILPDRHALARARELAAFCRKHKIPAVHLFMNAEEANRGHMTEPEIRRHLAMFRRIVPVLRRAGLAVSPSDAPGEVKKETDLVTKAAGGKGVFRELLELVLKTQGAWDRACERYYEKGE